MHAAVKPRFYGDDPARGIQSLEISIMPDPDFDRGEELAIRTFLDFLKRNDALEIRTPGPPEGSITFGAERHDLAVDW